MPEELVIVEELTELIVISPIEEEFVIHEPASIQLLEVVEQGPPGTPGAGQLADDPNPTLGGDLRLNNYAVVGEMESQTLVIDGGLL